MRFSLTPKMRECLDALRELTVDDVAPTYEELKVRLGLASKSGVHRLVRQLSERGYVSASRYGARSIAILNSDPVSRLTVSDLEHAKTETLYWLAQNASAIVAERAA